MCEPSQPPPAQNQPEDVTYHDTPCTAAARTGPRLHGARPRQRRAQIEDDRGLSRVPCREAAVTTPAGPQGADGPNIARVYDYLLGGSHNFDADRARMVFTLNINRLFETYFVHLRTYKIDATVAAAGRSLH